MSDLNVQVLNDVTSPTGGRALITWSAAATGSDYNLYRSDVEGELGSLIFTDPAFTDLDYIDVGVANGRVWYYTVKYDSWDVFTELWNSLTGVVEGAADQTDKDWLVSKDEGSYALFNNKLKVVGTSDDESGYVRFVRLEGRDVALQSEFRGEFEFSDWNSDAEFYFGFSREKNSAVTDASRKGLVAVHLDGLNLKFSYRDDYTSAFVSSVIYTFGSISAINTAQLRIHISQNGSQTQVSVYDMIGLVSIYDAGFTTFNYGTLYGVVYGMITVEDVNVSPDLLSSLIVDNYSDWDPEEISGGTGSALIQDVVSPDPVPSGSLQINNVSFASGGKLSLFWTVSPSVSQGVVYVVARNLTGNFDSTPLSADIVYQGVSTSFEDTGLTNKTYYFYGVYVKDAAGNYSAPVVGYGVPQDVVAPSPPTSLEAIRDGLIITTTWVLSPSSDVDHYIFSYGNDANSLEFSVKLSDEVASYAVEDFPLDESFYARIYAVDAAGNTSPYVVDSLVLSVPNAQVFSVYNPVYETGTLNLLWANSYSNNIKGQNIYRSLSPSGPWVLIAAVPVIFNSYSDDDAGAGLTNGLHYYYRLRSYDYSIPFVESSGLYSDAIPAAVDPSVAVRPPASMTVLDKEYSINVSWESSPEPPVIAGYIVKWSTNQLGWENQVDVGTSLNYVISSITSIDDVRVTVVAYDSLARESVPVDPYLRFLTGSRIEESFAVQRKESREVNFVWKISSSMKFSRIELDTSPDFSSPNKSIILYEHQVDDFVMSSSLIDFPLYTRTKSQWYWRVLPIYLGGFAGRYSNYTRKRLALRGKKWEDIVDEGTIIEGSVRVVSFYGTPYTTADYEVEGNRVRRKLDGSITDGETVIVEAQLIQVLEVRSNLAREVQDRMSKSLDRDFYGATNTSNIWKWYGISAAELELLKEAVQVLQDARIIKKCPAEELYKRFAEDYNLDKQEADAPYSYYLLSYLAQAIYLGGTKTAVELVCRGITGADCLITKLDSPEWILWDEDGPVFSDNRDFYLESAADTFVPESWENPVSFLESGDVYLLTLTNAARGFRGFILRDSRAGSSDFLGREKIIQGSLRLEDSNGAVIASTKYTVDYDSGILNWLPGEAPADGTVYTAIFGYSLVDLIDKLVRMVAPVDVSFFYNLYYGLVIENLGLVTWNVSLWNSKLWAGL